MATEIINKVIGGLAVGAVVGGTVGGIRGFMSRASYVDQLKPKPECFDIATDAAKLFCEMAKYRHLDENAYCEALHNTDSLFCLEKQIQLGEIAPQITDPATATGYAVRAMTHLRTIEEATQNDREHTDVKEKIQQLQGIYERHVRNIRLYCKGAPE